MIFRFHGSAPDDIPFSWIAPDDIPFSWIAPDDIDVVIGFLPAEHDITGSYVTMDDFQLVQLLNSSGDVFYDNLKILRRKMIVVV